MPPRNHFKDGIDAYLELMTEMSDASDRTAAIVAAAMLDDTLGYALSCRFIQTGRRWTERLFDGGDAPLGTLSAKVGIGYALGVFGAQTCADLDLVRGIRNRFAHSAQARRFSDKIISDRCMALTTPTTIVPGLGEPFPLQDARSRYLATCRHVTMQLVAEINTDPPLRPVHAKRLF